MLLRDHFFFIVSAKLTVQKYFYDENAPKFPLYVKASLDHVGKSSKRLSYHLYHQDAAEEYATCTVDDVLVSSKDRKPVAYPDWWMKKFGRMCKEKATPNFEIPTTLSETNCTKYQVNLTDIDTYKHTNWSAYIKFCFESVYKHVLDDNYSNINQNHIDGGVKSVNMIYKSESNLYDTLSVLTQEDKNFADRVYGNIIKEDGTLCFQVMMDLYDTRDKSNL